MVQKLKLIGEFIQKIQKSSLIRDLIVEGLSLARTQKEEFASILSSNDNNIDSLITKLKEFIEKVIAGPLDPNLGPIHYECIALTN